MTSRGLKGNTRDGEPTRGLPNPKGLTAFKPLLPIPASPPLSSSQVAFLLPRPARRRQDQRPGSRESSHKSRETRPPLLPPPLTSFPLTSRRRCSKNIKDAASAAAGQPGAGRWSRTPPPPAPDPRTVTTLSFSPSGPPVCVLGWPSRATRGRSRAARRVGLPAPCGRRAEA